ncbi:MAG: hypothetical protein IKU24_00995, partial [Clostridia bacterium]|nr:hypothetical protein [Clostridia bacterium]
SGFEKFCGEDEIGHPQYSKKLGAIPKRNFPDDHKNPVFHILRIFALPSLPLEGKVPRYEADEV